jgi:putative ABC transport system permease protein
MALRESRAAWRRIALYTGAITLGVAALVAINSFRADVLAGVHAEARVLLGADLEMSSRQPFPEEVQQTLDSAAQAGTDISYATRFASMALAPRTGLTRLVNVRAMAGRYPYYGRIETDPATAWSQLGTGRKALVDPGVLVYLDAQLGDTLRIGQAAFVISGVVTKVPGDIGLRTAIGPSVYIPRRYVEETGLIQFGSLVRYMAYLEIPDIAQLEAFLDTWGERLRELRVGYDTVEEREEEWAESLNALARFLGLVGLIALLLGGIGVASAVHVFVKRRLDTVAVLRCLGASQRTVFAVYLVQAALMGALGSVAGVALGLVVQWSLPGVLQDFLPLDVAPVLHAGPVLTGLGIGIWVAVLFGLLPLLTVRDVAPLRALRRAYDAPPARRDPARLLTYAALALTAIGLSVSQAPGLAAGLAFAAAIAFTTGALWLVAKGLTRATRRFFPRRAPYVVRQGVANLFRPHNQTVSVILTLGFGLFLLGSLHVVQRNLLEQFAFDVREDRPNLVIFDIQRDQREGIADILRERGLGTQEFTPIVPARIAALNDRSVSELLDDTTGTGPSRWALRREYRNTYRDTLVSSEELIAGEWWDEPRGERAPGAQPPLPRISMERDVADDLTVGVGDRITWDVQGVRLETEIASLRTVDWARFEPNFFAVFEPGVLESAPQIFVTFTRVEGDAGRAEVQRDLVQRYPNISALDLSLVQQTIDTILGSVTVAVRFMALFSIACGMIVLIGAIGTSRYQRLRESVLLKTLGARTRQVTGILATEYFALGTLAALTGLLLATVAGWALVTFFFRMTFRLQLLPLLELGLATIVVTIVVGLLSSRDIMRRAPLAVMREITE